MRKLLLLLYLALSLSIVGCSKSNSVNEPVSTDTTATQEDEKLKAEEEAKKKAEEEAKQKSEEEAKKKAEEEAKKKAEEEKAKKIEEQKLADEALADYINSDYMLEQAALANEEIEPLNLHVSFDAKEGGIVVIKYSFIDQIEVSVSLDELEQMLDDSLIPMFKENFAGIDHDIVENDVTYNGFNIVICNADDSVLYDKVFDKTGEPLSGL